MDGNKVKWLVIAALTALVLWLWSWCQPEKQVRRAQERLLDAIESRDFAAMSALLAQDYRDRWGHDKGIVLSRTREVFEQFGLLSIEREDRGLLPAGGMWVMSDKIRVKGLGTPLAMAARDRVNGLEEPFEMHWRRRGWKPWDWELTRVDHPRLEIE